MNRHTQSLIDQTIRHHMKNRKNYGELHVYDLDQDERNDLLRDLLKTDDVLQEIITDHMQGLIDERIDIVYAENQYEAGRRPYIDRINGEVSWR